MKRISGYELIKSLGLIAILLMLLEINNEQKRQTIILQQRTLMDSLYIDHLTRCSFIPSDKLTVGFDGYLKIKE